MLNNVMDLREASKKSKISINTLKSICQNESYDLIRGKDFKRSGRVWLITKDALEHIIAERELLSRNRSTRNA